jgi:hypothetical protein
MAGFGLLPGILETSCILPDGSGPWKERLLEKLRKMLGPGKVSYPELRTPSLVAN